VGRNTSKEIIWIFAFANAAYMKIIDILVFNDVELLDFAGPMQVFSSLAYLKPEYELQVCTIGLEEEIKLAKSNTIIKPDKVIASTAPEADLLIIPGGKGTRQLIHDTTALSDISNLIEGTDKVASVCTGSLVLAKLGKLKSKKATTHYMALDLIKSIDPSIDVDRSKRYHDHGDIIVSEGVSAGIDMSFHIISTRYGQDVSEEVRKYIEYYPEDYAKQ